MISENAPRRSRISGGCGRRRERGPDGFIYLALEGPEGELMTRIVRLEPVATDVAPPMVGTTLGS